MGCGGSVETDEPEIFKTKPTPGMLPNMHELLEGAKIPQADCVLPLLYLGNMSASKNLEKLKELGIRRIVNATPHPPSFPEDFAYHSVAVEDTQSANIKPHLSTCVKFIAAGIEAGEAVFVHCEMGMSRSSTVVVAYLMHHKGWSVRRAFLQVKMARPIVRITKTFLFVLFDMEMKLAEESELDMDLLVEEGMAEMVEGGDTILVTATALQLFFFPTDDSVVANLKAVGLFPPEWDAFKNTFLSGIDMGAFSDQVTPPLADFKTALSKRSSKNAYLTLKKSYPGFVSPFYK